MIPSLFLRFFPEKYADRRASRPATPEIITTSPVLKAKIERTMASPGWARLSGRLVNHINVVNGNLVEDHPLRAPRSAANERANSVPTRR